MEKHGEKTGNEKNNKYETEGDNNTLTENDNAG